MWIDRTTRKVHAAVALILVAVLWTACVSLSLAQTGEPRTITLNEAIDLALKHNRTLQLARLNAAETKQKKEIARSSYFPQLKNESNILHVTALEQLEIPAGAFGAPSTGLIPAQNVYLGQGSLTGYTSGTSIAQPITQIFKIHEANRAADADTKIADFQTTGAEEAVALKIREVYFGILIAQLKVDAAKEQLNTAQTKSAESAADIQRGNALEVARIESQAAVLESKQEVLTEQLASHDLQLTLKDLIGLPLKTDVVLNDTELILNSPIPSRSDCIELAKQRNTELQAAKELVRKAQAGLAAAKDAYIPDVTGLARYSYESGVPLLPHNFGTFAINFSWELFDGGRRAASIRDAEIQLTQARTHEAQLAEDVEIEIETAYDKMENTQSLVSVAQEALALRTEAARIADAQFQQDEVLPSQRSQAHALLASAKASLLQANLGMTLAQGDLLRTVGQMPR